jgi:hypothetical protein
MHKLELVVKRFQRKWEAFLNMQNFPRKLRAVNPLSNAQ